MGRYQVSVVREDFREMLRYAKPAALGDTILYVEHWVDGKKVDHVVEPGVEVEVRVVFEITEPPWGGTYRLALQRYPAGEKVDSPNWPRTPGTFYIAWKWKVDYAPGSYTLRVWLYNDNWQIDYKEFPHVVKKPPVPPEEEVPPWWEQPFLGVPVWMWLTGAVLGTVVIGGVAYAVESRRREEMMMLMMREGGTEEVKA